MAVAVDGSGTLAPDPAVTLPTSATPLRLALAPDGTSAAVALAGGILTVLDIDVATNPPSLTVGGGGGAEKNAIAADGSTPLSPAVAAARRQSTDQGRGSPTAAAARAVVGLAGAVGGAVGGALATPGRVLLHRGSGGGSSKAGTPTAGAAASGPSRLPSVSVGSEVKCLAFDAAGATLAAGCEDGAVRFYAWPGLAPAGELRPVSPADEAAAAAAASGAPVMPGGPRPRPPGTADGIRDVAFSPAHGDRVVAVVHESGGARLWRWEAGGGVGGALALTHAAVVAAAAGAPPARRGVAGAGRPVIGRVRFDARRSDAPPRLLGTVAAGGKGFVVAWEGGGMAPGRAVAALPSPATAFELSGCGSCAAAGSADGDVAVLDARTLRALRRVPGAHMVFVTALAFAPAAADAKKDGRASLPAVVSVSGDASAVVTTATKRGRAAVAAALAFVLLAAALLLLLAASQQQRRPLPPAVDIWREVEARVRAAVAGAGGAPPAAAVFGVVGDRGEL